MDKEYMPDFPVVVVKDNERLVSNATLSQFNALNTDILNEGDTGFLLKYASQNYQNLNIRTNYQSGPRVNQVLTDAFNAYGNYTPGGWQRDFVYYGLTPSTVNGQLNPQYHENLTSFQLSGHPASAYSWIATSQDPVLQNIVFSNNLTQIAGWTEGDFEIIVSNFYGAKNSSLGAEERKQFGARPIDLFEISYVAASNGFMGQFIKRPVITGLKNIDLYNGAYFGTRMEFSVWDLNSFANQWKLQFEESDSTTDITTTINQSNKYNANFSIEPSTGILKKIGLKFGASYEQNLSNTYTSKYVDSSDNLGSNVINFYDNAVYLNSATNTIVPRTYSTGKVIFEFRPVLSQ